MDTLPFRLQEALGRDYRIEGELGGGGMSRVFAAVEVELDRRVVIKVLPPETAADVSVERFRREIQVAAGLQHPHIVPLLTAGRAGDIVYYVMPLVEGESLRARIEREGPLPAPTVIAILREVAEALAYAHRRGVVHRDIKPDNVLIAEGHALVTDFGVAKALGHSTGGAMLTSAGMAVGTPAYMAPEQAAGDPGVDHRADIYAVGALAYELLAGRLPFAGFSYQQILAAQLTESPTPLVAYRGDLPPALDRLVTRCLARDPGARFQSATELFDELARLATPAGSVAARPRWPASRRRGVTAAAVAMLALAAGWFAWRGRRDAPAASPTAIAVMPFAVRGGSDIAYLGEGIVSLLSTSLDGAGDLRAVDPRAVLGVARREAAGSLDPTGAGRIAARFGAGLYVLGDIVQAGPQLRIDAALYRRAGGEPSATATAQGTADQLFQLVDSVAVQLLAGRGSGPGARITRIAAVTTSSLPALKAYLEGEAHFRAGRFAPAVEAFDSAVRADSMFALAYYRLSLAAEWALQLDRSTVAADAAVRHASRLSEHDRALLDARLVWRQGRSVEAERRYRAIAARYPDDIEAWFQLGEVLFHDGALYGRALEEAREPFERVVAFEPDHATALIHLVRIAGARRDRAAVDSLVQRVLQLNPGGERALEMRGMQLALADGHADWSSFEAELAAGNPAAALQGVYSVYMFGGNLDATDRLLGALAASGGTPVAVSRVRAMRAHYHAALGRLREAQADLRRVGGEADGELLAHRALLATLPFAATPADSLRRLRDQLLAWDAGAERPSPLPSAYFNTHDGLYPAIRLYLLGRVAAALGDTAALRRHAEALDRLPGPPQARAVAQGLGRGLTGWLLVARGQPRDALALLEPTVRDGGYEPKLFSPFISRPAERYLVGELLDSLGRDDDARAWLGSVLWFGIYDRAWAGPAQLRIARIFERAGRRDSAAAYYQRVLELWDGSDPELRPLVEDARAALARLVAEPRR
ncbi:MAG TPA: protein kinase [Gemmatimonadales bacterium]|nr:protein kinase [Gemmatimonadales bacterium]